MKSLLFAMALLVAIIASGAAQYAAYTTDMYQTTPPTTTRGTNSSSNSGWQDGKSLAESNRYMLDNKIGTDVILKVVPKSGAATEIEAHKFVLSSRNAVFEQLLKAKSSTSSTGEKVTLVIQDMDVAVFKVMLNFLYSDNVTVSASNVLSVMAAAKKYQVTKLADECQTMIENNISADNVCEFLDQAIIFNDEKLTNKTIEYISANANAVATTNGCLEMSSTALTKIVSYDCLQISEFLLYTASLKWAKNQLQKVSNYNPTDQALRKQLGDAFSKYRFPTMTLEEFANISRSDMLTCDEKASIYNYIGTRDQANPNTFGLTFNHRNRSCEKLVDRYSMVYYSNWGGSNQKDAIQFKTDKDMTLTAIGTYPSQSSCGYYYYATTYGPITLGVDVNEVSQTTNYYYPYGTTYYNGLRVGGISSYTANSTTYDNKNVAKLPLQASIKIRAGVLYCITLRQVNGQGCYSHYGQTYYGSDSVKTECGTMWFSTPTSSSTSTSSGQIPRLYVNC